jgi:prepilin-type N-terminal cleavage/methylation domain-containing protein
MMPTPSRSERGFTLLEMLIALAITVVVMTIVLVSLDANTKVTQIQMDVGDLQQSTRVSHRGMSFLTRMAGRGGLPRPLAVLVQQNVPDDTTIAGEPVEEATDVLTIRGAFTAPIYRIDSDDPGAFVRGATTATLLVDSVTASGFRQSLDFLENLLDEDGEVPPEAVVLVGRQGDAVYGVAELASMTFANVALDIQNQSVPVRRATMIFNITPDSGEHTAEYIPLSSGGAFPNNLTSVVFMSVLQEYRYYVRPDFAIPGDATSPPRPKLCRAQMFPATEAVYAGEQANAAVEIADNMVDLQVALGIDFDGDGVVEDTDADGNPLATDEDEWQFNAVDDEDTLAWSTAPLHYVRLTTLGHTRSPDRQYVSPAIEQIENRVYDEDDTVLGGELIERRYRRRMLQNVIDMRDL